MSAVGPMGQPHPADSQVDQARQRALQLAQQRRQIDAEMQTHADVLKREGVNLTSPLVDSQGFPLNTVDIPSIRHARAKIIALQNDRKAIDTELASLVDVALAKGGHRGGDGGSGGGGGGVQEGVSEIEHEVSSFADSQDPKTPPFMSTLEKFETQGDKASGPLVTSAPTNTTVSAKALLSSLSFLDRFLPVWIFLAVVIGVLIGEFVPGVQTTFATSGQVQGVAAPLVVGLIVMMWPILTKVKYERGKELVQSRRVWTQIAVSLFLNWVLGPFIMLALAWATLPDLPTYRTGIILVGVARCIAMVNIWVSLAKGDCDICALVVIVNSLLQIVLFSPYCLFLINVISNEDTLELDYSHTAIAVALYLGVPLAAGVVTRFSLILLLGKRRFEDKFLPYFGALSLLALLYVVIVIFALQAKRVLNNLGPTFRCFVPLVLYFTVMWVGTFVLCWRLSRKYSKTFDYQMTVVQAFTAGSNNFELAIAIAVSAYGAGSDQALAATIGPFVEIPVLLALTYVSLWLGKKWSWGPKGKGEDVEEKGVD